MEQTVSIQMDGGHVTSTALIHSNNSDGLTKPGSYEFFFSDLQEMLLKGKTLYDYFVMVLTTSGTSYKGLDKLTYVNVIKALQTVIESRKRHVRRCVKLKDAIAFLHQDIKFSPSMIQNLLSLFDVKLGTLDILKASYKVFSEKSQPKWLQNIEMANPPH